MLCLLLLTDENALNFLLAVSVMNDDPESNPYSFDTYVVLQLF